MNLNGIISRCPGSSDRRHWHRPRGNINYTPDTPFSSHPRHRPKYADKDMVNPGSVILSGEMMLRYLGWHQAADLVIKGMEGAIQAKTVTYDSTA